MEKSKILYQDTMHNCSIKVKSKHTLIAKGSFEESVLSRLSTERVLTGLSTDVEASQVVLMLKNLPANAGDVRDASSVPGSGRSLGRGHGYLLQYSCLENPMEPGGLQSIKNIINLISVLTIW